MSSVDNRYSRFVAALKILLPLAALALLSTLFLLARVPESTLPGRITGEIAADGRMSGPTFSTMTRDGPLTVTALTAIPRESDYAVVDLQGLDARLEIRDGATLTLTSDTGRLMRGTQEAQFEGSVEIQTSDGYRLTTALLRSAFDGSSAESPGKVRLTGPGLTLDAGAMRVPEGSGGLAGGRLLFNQGVRLVYVPPSATPAEKGPQ